MTPARSHRNARPSTTAVALVALALVASLAPPTLGHHLSAGVEDAVGLDAREPPADTSQALYDRGTRTDCGDVDTSDPSTTTDDAFCGQLVYNEDTGYETLSPRDQEHSLDVTIDLQMATYVGLYGTATCSPWCNSPTTYEAAHDLGASLGLTPASEDVDDGGTQAYGGHVYAASPMQLFAQVEQPWLLPVTDTSFVAFVDGPDGLPLDEQRLGEIVSAAKDQGKLAETARPAVCAFTPQATLGTHAADAGRCEVELAWMGETGDRGPCHADAYLCGTSQPAWRGTTMCPMWHAACYLSDAWNSAHHFAVWHGVVAPSAPSGCAAAEPGFDMDPFTFLAHDLDVYTPPSDATPAKGLPHYWDEAAENVPGLGPLREGRAPPVADSPAGQTVRDTRLFTGHEPEPNTDGWLGIEESSHQETQDRTIDECQTLATGEQEADPWINVVDAHVTRDLAGFGVPLGSGDEPDHDPRPSMRVTGHVGLFADVDDDGEYDQAPASEVFEVEKHGAYPILWDHHDEGEGCEFRSGKHFGDVTTGAGYADPTGLAVTLRISAGTLVDTRTGQLVDVPLPTAVAFLSAGLDPQNDVVREAIDRAAGQRPTIVLEDAFQPQCGEPTGGFTSAWEVQAVPLDGDGLAAAAIVTVDGGAPGAPDSDVPPSPIELSGTHVWWDVDPFESTLE